jgi:endo-1,4-beta-xylanase
MKLTIVYNFLLVVFVLSGCAKKEKQAPKEAVSVHANSSTNTIDLRQAFKSYFLMGSAVNEPIFSGADSLSKNIVINDFNTITPENCMKAESVNPTPNVYYFKATDAFVEFGKKNKKFIVGHTLIWHNQTPKWFFSSTNRMSNSIQQQKGRMCKHIEAVAGRYKGKVDAWDVVYEVIDNDGSYRPTTWVNTIGDSDEMVKLAFKYASEYAPNTELYYNDFNA